MEIENTEQEINFQSEDITVIASMVNDVKVNGDSVVDNHVAYIEVPTKVSELENDKGFITNAVNNLINYYRKNETYTKSQINDLISSIQGASFEIIQTLPPVGQPNIIYLVPVESPTQQNYYDEYIFINNSLEKIGNTQIDLSGYVKKTDYAGTTSSNPGIVWAQISRGIELTNDGEMKIQRASDSDILAKSSGYYPITPNGLDYAVKVGVTTNTNTLSALEKTNAQTWLGLSFGLLRWDE